MSSDDGIRIARVDWKKIGPAEIDAGSPAPLAITKLIEGVWLHGRDIAQAFAHHIVATHLSLRFPELDIKNERYVEMRHANWTENFLLGDTVIHITVEPSEDLMVNRCRATVRHSKRVLVLAPEDRVLAAHQLAVLAGHGDSVAVTSIEGFIGTSIEQVSAFSTSQVTSCLRELIECYNERVRASESDRPLQIEIPRRLSRSSSLVD